MRLEVPLIDGMSGSIVMGSLATMTEKHLEDYESCWKHRLDQVEAVGGQLLQFARMRSDQLGYGGLVGLHSLPESEMFYTKMNMIDCDLDEEYDNLRYFEWYQPRPSIMDDLDL